MPRWDLGVWVGKINDSDEHVLLTPFGSKRATSIRGLPERSKWNSDFLKTVRGLLRNPMETEVEKVTTVDIGKARRLYITKAMVVESGETLGCLGCTGIQKFHDENSRMSLEIIYLHTAAMPTTAAPIPESETPTCADAADEEAVTAVPSSAAEKRKSESDDETVETKRTAVEMSAKDVEMNNTECKDEVTADPVRYQASEGKRRRVAARIEESVEHALGCGDVDLIAAVQEAIESEKDEQEEPDEIWGGERVA